MLSSLTICVPAVLAAGGCASFRDVPAKPLALPASQSVDEVRVTYRYADKQPELVIKDRARIAVLLAFLSQRNQNWRTPFGTVPSGDYAVSLESKGQMLLSLGITRGWIGGWEQGQNVTGFRLRNIPPEDWTILAEILGIPPNSGD